MILSTLRQEGFDVYQLHAIVGRGGLVKPIESGIYEVDETLAMISNIRSWVNMLQIWEV